MPYDNCRKAARLFSSHLDVVRPAPVGSTRRGFAHKREGVRPSESCASLRGQSGRCVASPTSPDAATKRAFFQLS